MLLRMQAQDRPQQKRFTEDLGNCLMLVTALNPHIGHEKAGKTFLTAYTGKLLYVRLR
jgi:fumarate hydratase class II